jgi:L-malate glycosyltransferase
MKRIRILFIILKTQQGGAETQMLNLLRRMDKKKFYVHLGILYEHHQLRDEFYNIRGVNVVNFKKKDRFDFRIYFKIARFIRENKIDIVQTFIGNHHAYIPALLTRKCIAIGGIREQPAKNPSLIERIKGFMIPRFLMRMNKFILISNSQAAKDAYLAKGFRSDKVYIIPNGIDYGLFSKGTKTKVVNEFRLKNKIVLCMVGRLVNGKNHDELIRHFKGLREDYRNAVLLLVGDGPEMASLKGIANECGESANVIFTGNRKDVPDILAATDIFVFPSQSEGWPNVVGEAMAAGVPVVSYPAGDIKLIIRDGYDGIIARPNMDSFMREVNDLLKDKNRMRIIGRNAGRVVKERFSIDALARNYERLYLELLK